MLVATYPESMLLAEGLTMESEGKMRVQVYSVAFA